MRRTESSHLKTAKSASTHRYTGEQGGASTIWLVSTTSPLPSTVRPRSGSRPPILIVERPTISRTGSTWILAMVASHHRDQLCTKHLLILPTQLFSRHRISTDLVLSISVPMVATSSL